MVLPDYLNFYLLNAYKILCHYSLDLYFLIMNFNPHGSTSTSILQITLLFLIFHTSLSFPSFFWEVSSTWSPKLLTCSPSLLLFVHLICSFQLLLFFIPKISYWFVFLFLFLIAIYFLSLLYVYEANTGH